MDHPDGMCLKSPVLQEVFDSGSDDPTFAVCIRPPGDEAVAKFFKDRVVEAGYRFVSSL